MKRKTKTKAVQYDTIKLSRIYFSIVALLFIIDVMILTPIILVNKWGTESNEIHDVGYQAFGITYFFFFAPFMLIYVYIIFRGVDTVSLEFAESKIKTRIGLLTVVLIYYAVQFIGAIINNVRIILIHL